MKKDNNDIPISEWSDRDIIFHLRKFRGAAIIVLLSIVLSIIPIPYIQPILAYISPLCFIILLSVFLGHIIIIADKKLNKIEDAGANAIFGLMLLIFLFASLIGCGYLFKLFFDIF